MISRIVFPILAVCLLANAADAVVVVTAEEVGNDVVFTAEGSLVFDGLTLTTGLATTGYIWPLGSTFAVQDAPLTLVDRYSGVITSPVDFGSGSAKNPSSGSSSTLGVGSNFVLVPTGYNPGDPLSASMTFENHSFATLGIEYGEYTWSWGSQSGGDSIRLVAVPEPSAFFCLGLIAMVSVGYYVKTKGS